MSVPASRCWIRGCTSRPTMPPAGQGRASPWPESSWPRAQVPSRGSVDCMFMYLYIHVYIYIYICIICIIPYIIKNIDM